MTSVLGVLAKPALVPWANRLGLQGIDTRKYVDATAQIGTLAHALIAESIGGPPVDRKAWSSHQLEQAMCGVKSFRSWRSQHTFRATHAELQLVSERHRYGGTIDCYAIVDGERTLIDFKTSKAIYPEHVHQVAAYHRLLVENKMRVNRVRILRIGRSPHEGFSEHVYSLADLIPHWKLFRACLEVYRLQREMRSGT